MHLKPANLFRAPPDESSMTYTCDIFFAQVITIMSHITDEIKLLGLD